MGIYLIYKFNNKRIQNLIHSLNLKHDKNASMALVVNHDSLELNDLENPKKGSIKVDFTSKKNNYRCYKSKMKKEILYRAIGIKKSYFPFVLDLTGGLGSDAFILSFLGCRVIMIERHPVVMALLRDGLDRGYKDKKIGFWLKKRLFLIFNDSLKIKKLPILQPDVIYIDPMYPDKKKTALPKKEMQFLQKLIGKNDDCDHLITLSKELAKKRIVVKRPCYAPPLSKEKVDFIIKGKSHRFDIYNSIIK
ncbi:16S rRNA methyltransferase [Buchnera aphidicola (Muscaphis stroyani)]|uniref:Ribosomal RNA small subunit methyltransferase J n=1 Tax=Buchnera aphidicola (Muscaphis stroyani) TaxID=1241869 RepID=A0A4D6YFF9_9GAMM|nr:class I SAM-dependent methyltransferase [Buchnera aphidicola]QCI24614.1 16S rRNA methyltransferase [Buchnera aphidicola (Muscaphis stroyani)]